MSVAGQLELPHTAEEVATYVVGTAVWAPSVHNTQPWQFSAQGSVIDLRADPLLQLAVADPSGREMMMSCGAALFTAKLALRSLGYVPETRTLPDPGDPLLVARLRWRRQSPPTSWEEKLFSCVPKRRTHRGGFEPIPVPDRLIENLRQDASWHGTALRVAISDQARAVLAAITESAERAERLDSRYARELAAWAPPPGSSRLDGVPVSAYPALKELTTPYFPGRDFGQGHGWGLPFGTQISPFRVTGLVCLLTTVADGPAEWLNAGQALQHILLTATTYGVAAALHSQPVEVSWLRDAMREQLADGTYPQLVLRFGTAIQDAISIRRPAASVLTTRRVPPAGAVTPSAA